jgi:hypothetical protein
MRSILDDRTSAAERLRINARRSIGPFVVPRIEPAGSIRTIV